MARKKSTTTIVLSGLPPAELQELHEIVDRDGELRTAAVVARARDEKSALHHRFEWDKDKAHEAHLLVQARSLIARVTVEVIGQPTQTIRAYASVGTGNERTYMSMTDIIKSPPMLESVRQGILTDLRSVQRRLSALDEFSHLTGRLDTIITELEEGS